MIYADTDFFLALLKEDDWLRKNAHRLYKRYEGSIVTHALTIVELAIVCRREGIPVDETLHEVFRIARVEGMALDRALVAADLITLQDLTPFDAFHVAMSGDRPILSSDKAYDVVGKERISLEKE